MCFLSTRQWCFFEHPEIPPTGEPSTGWGSNWTRSSFTQCKLYMTQAKWPLQRTDMQMSPTSSCGWYSLKRTGGLFQCLCACVLCVRCGSLETVAITHCCVVRPWLSRVRTSFASGRNGDRWIYYNTNEVHKLLHCSVNVDSGNLASWWHVLLGDSLVLVAVRGIL
jgi:hypothetical protein